MFVIKDPDLFASQVIPQYFDHNKFSSFARQLNFYGFRKIQAKPIRNADFDQSTAKHVTFFNEKFKRGRCDLLKEIQRSTRGTTQNGQQALVEHQKEVSELRTYVEELETTIANMKEDMEERMRKLELDMLGQMEQMMLAIQQYQQSQITQFQQRAISGSLSIGADGTTALDPMASSAARRTASISSTLSMAVPIVSSESIGTQRTTSNSSTASAAAPPPTLPPHPKQKQLPLGQGMLPPNMTIPPSRLNSLRGLSRGLSRGMSVESTASAVLMRNSWEDKFFSMLMLGENEAAAAMAAASPGTTSVVTTDQASTGTNSGAVPSTTDTNVEAALAATAVEAMTRPQMTAEQQLLENPLSSMDVSEL